MIIREATINDLPNMENEARSFFSSSKNLHEFNLNKFCQLWKTLIDNKTGIIFIIAENETIFGALGGVIYPDTYSDDLIATEFFWWVNEHKRGKGLELYYKFEEWGKNNGCKRIRMAHLCDLMPDNLKWLYGEMGFKPVEINYEKELMP